MRVGPRHGRPAVSHARRTCLAGALAMALTACLLGTLPTARAEAADAALPQAGIHLAPDAADASTVIGFIGDSITWGTSADAPRSDSTVVPSDTLSPCPSGFRWVQNHGPTTGYTCAIGDDRSAPGQAVSSLGPAYVAVNEGHPGATTTGWATGSHAGSYSLASALENFRAHDVTVVAIMLGTNDADSLDDAIAWPRGQETHAVPGEVYQANMRAIIDQLLAGGMTTVVLNFPIDFDAAFARTHPSKGTLDAQAVARLQAYRGILSDLVQSGIYGDSVILGSTATAVCTPGAAGGRPCSAGDIALGDGVHPTAAGYALLGQQWAHALAISGAVAITDGRPTVAGLARAGVTLGLIPRVWHPPAVPLTYPSPRDGRPG